jgi:hypothetical protein
VVPVLLAGPPGGPPGGALAGTQVLAVKKTAGQGTRTTVVTSPIATGVGQVHPAAQAVSRLRGGEQAGR